MTATRRIRLLKYREHAVANEARQLRRAGSPRLQMALIVAITGGVGFLSSVALLRAGLDSMALRYPMCVAIAYVAFIGLLWCWLRLRPSNFDSIDLPSGGGSSPSSTAGDPYKPGGGGDFAGGGGGSGFDDVPARSLASLDHDPLPFGDVAQGAGDAASSSFDLDFGDVFFIAILLAVLFAMGWVAIGVISTAPVLFAELLVDAGLSGSLYRRMKGVHGPHWLQTALSRTWWRFSVVGAVAFAVGIALQVYAPNAKTIGRALAEIGR